METVETGGGAAGMALAMLYVPVQSWETPYDPETALARGTVFPALDKPFLAAGGDR